MAKVRWSLVIVLAVVVVGLLIVAVDFFGKTECGINDTRCAEPVDPDVARERIGQAAAEERVPEEIELHMRVFSGGYSPDTIEAHEGDFVTIHLRSTDGLAHGFVIDDLNIAERIEPGAEVDITFRAKHEGTYEIYSHVASNPNVDNMKGQLIIH